MVVDTHFQNTYFCVKTQILSLATDLILGFLEVIRFTLFICKKMSAQYPKVCIIIVCQLFCQKNSVTWKTLLVQLVTQFS